MNVLHPCRSIFPEFHLNGEQTCCLATPAAPQHSAGRVGVFWPGRWRLVSVVTGDMIYSVMLHLQEREAVIFSLIK